MRRIAWRLFLGTGLVVLCLAVGFYAWARNGYSAEPTAYATAIQDGSVRIRQRQGFLIIEPAESKASRALLFYPGLRVEPEAYVAKLAKLANAARMAVVIGRPPLNIAALSIAQADEMRSAVDGIKDVYIGGHSLGGAMACVHARNKSHDFKGVILFGTYCGSDLTGTALRVLDLVGSRDGVIAPSVIEQHRAELPANATVAVIPGMNHSQFGNYGPQCCEAAADIDDRQAQEAIVSAVKAFLETA